VSTSHAAPLLRLDGVGKDYVRIRSRHGRLGVVWDLLRGRKSTHVFRAIDNVSLDMARGESLGVVGENGAGKSTLLKLIAGVVPPTCGRVTVNGRVSALLELGSGFHPEYSGLANIDLAAALLGLSSREIADKRAEIAAFADLGDHINDPIKSYSSGMIVRLGFAVATAVRPDILITDEVLAVGDESFQKKCVAWIEGFLAQGGTLLLCSHSMYHVQKLCRHALWLKDGRVEAYGHASDVTRDYLAYHEERSESRARPPVEVEQVRVAGLYSVRGFTVDPPHQVASGGDIVLRGELFSPDGRAPGIGIGLLRADGTAIYGFSAEMDGSAPARIAGDRFAFELVIPRLPLLPGKYYFRAHAVDPEGLRVFDAIEVPYVVTGSTRELGLVHIEHEWRNDVPAPRALAAQR